MGFAIGDYAKVKYVRGTQPSELEEVPIESKTVVDLVDFQNSWVNYSISDRNLGYWCDLLNDECHVEGIVKDGTVGTIFVLPSAYWPPAKFYFAVPSLNGSTWGQSFISVSAIGEVKMEVMNGNDWVDINITCKL